MCHMHSHGICRDVTAATWGGSTVQSDPEDTASSVSLPSDIVADITQESNGWLAQKAQKWPYSLWICYWCQIMEAGVKI